MNRDPVDWAMAEAEARVKPLGRRWLHVQSVAACADETAARLCLDRDVLSAAAWLHDIGYAEELLDTGFHPLDGARHLRRVGCDERVVSLVAHHSCASLEAEVRGLESVLAQEYPRPEAAYEDALCYCDMTNGPTGEQVSAVDRLNEIQERYGPGDVVTRFVESARREILASVGRTEAALNAAGAQSR